MCCNKLSKTHIDQLKALGAFAGMADQRKALGALPYQRHLPPADRGGGEKPQPLSALETIAVMIFI